MCWNVIHSLALYYFSLSLLCRSYPLLDRIISHCNTVLTSSIYVGVACVESLYTHWHYIIFHCPCYVDHTLCWTELQSLSPETASSPRALMKPFLTHFSLKQPNFLQSMPLYLSGPMDTQKSRYSSPVGHRSLDDLCRSTYTMSQKLCVRYTLDARYLYFKRNVEKFVPRPWLRELTVNIQFHER